MFGKGKMNLELRISKNELRTSKNKHRNKMIRIKYKELFSLEIEHNFYENKFCAKYKTVPISDFQFVPTSETVALMKRLGMTFRANPQTNGLTVFAEVKENLNVDDYLLRVTPPDGSRLSFVMNLKNNNFLNFTDLDFKSGEIFYVNNRVIDAGAIRNDLHLMTDNDQVKSTKDVVKGRNSDYMFEHNTMVAMGTVKVKLLDSDKLIDPKFIQKSPTGSTIIFGLQKEPVGNCQLEVGGVVKERFYHTSNLENVFGIIEFYFDNMMSANYRILDVNALKFNVLKKDKPLYKVKFANRKSFWKYIVVVQNNGALKRDLNLLLNPADKDNYVNKLKLNCNDAATVFTKTSGLGADAQYVFTSNLLLDLKERFFANGSTQDLKMALRKNVGTLSESDLKTSLPLPNIIISPVKDLVTNVVTVYSEVVVLV